MDKQLDYPEHFNPTPDSEGIQLYEHWEESIPHSQEYSLLAIATTPLGMELKKGDWILKRRYGPASEPMLYNRARHELGAS